uniref:Uncharacterized protein n=1 Tax=Tanacetum cinerariifolium TaxID=118510 RepID=A0A699HPE5_TANCI|nr:hypothetical protein [Tanacetum cinerariifolium]
MLIKKLIPTHVLKVLANYVKLRLNNSVLEVMQNNQINLFTKPSTFVDDLLDMDLKLRLLNRIQENKTHPTNQILYDILYDSILLDQEALDAQEAEPSFHERTHDHQDPPLIKSGSANAIRRTTWFDFLLKSNIDQNEDHIIGPSTVAIANKLKEIIQKDELTIADLEVLFESQWNNDEGDVSKPRSFERHMSKSSKPYSSFYNNDFYYLAYLSTKEKYTTSLTKRYPTRYYIQDLPRLNLNDIEDMYLLKVQDKMHHLPLDDEKDFNNALLLFIQRTIIKNRVEDLQLGVESYQRTLNLTKPKLYFDEIDEKIPYTMTRTKKGVVYLNKYNRRSLMKLNEVHKFCDGGLEYQVVYTRPNKASADVDMLDGFDHGGARSWEANLQHMEALLTTEAGYMIFTEAWKINRWLNRLTKDLRGCELRLVAGIAIGAFTKAVQGSRFQQGLWKLMCIGIG